MVATLKTIARAVLPRSARNALRSPARSLRWWWQEKRDSVDFSPCPGWKFRCPPLAVENAFHLQQDDPPQAAEFQEFLNILRHLEEPLFFDLGCHFGLFGFAALHFCGSGTRVIAVDPSDIACAMVRRISAQNSWDKGIRIIQAAVGEKSGELEMVSGGVASAGYFTLPTDQPSADRTTVRLLTIDQLTDEMGRVPDLIKIDVEGFEFEVLRGASKTLRTGIPILCLELHNRLMLERGLKPAEILCDLRRNGYVHWTCGGQAIDESTILQAEIVRIVASNKILPA